MSNEAVYRTALATQRLLIAIVDYVQTIRVNEFFVSSHKTELTSISSRILNLEGHKKWALSYWWLQ